MESAASVASSEYTRAESETVVLRAAAVAGEGAGAPTLPRAQADTAVTPTPQQNATTIARERAAGR